MRNSIEGQQSVSIGAETETQFCSVQQF